VPRLVVDHGSCGVERIPVQERRTARSTAFRTRVSTGVTPVDHHEVRRTERDTDASVCEGSGPTRSIRTRPHDGHRSDSHGITEWQKGQGRYPEGMSPPVPFILCRKSCSVLPQCSSSIRLFYPENVYPPNSVNTIQGYTVRATGPFAQRDR
jgi:hypothetical protein